jgi:hypothetical protein
MKIVEVLIKYKKLIENDSSWIKVNFYRQKRKISFMQIVQIYDEDFVRQEEERRITQITDWDTESDYDVHQ